MDDEYTIEILLQHINRKNIRVGGLINKLAQLIILLYNILAIMLLMHSFTLTKIMPLKKIMDTICSIAYISIENVKCLHYMEHMEDI